MFGSWCLSVAPSEKRGEKNHQNKQTNNNQKEKPTNQPTKQQQQQKTKIENREGTV